jgi:drug/metabolite transporter (DMT)-like permease
VEEIKSTKGKWLGAVSGIANGLANFFTLILAGSENASILFPCISAGTLLGAIVCGRFLFKEKLKLNHYFALVFGILAVVFLKINYVNDQLISMRHADIEIRFKSFTGLKISIAALRYNGLVEGVYVKNTP